ncbi:MAG: tetratricopeptide repeat protein [Melioribacteraceae bacterium]|nr:tetratricopeptide repeat protein [Melioribacteraceae bacterium]
MRIVKIIILFFISFVSLFGNKAETLMNEANQLYQKKQYEEAIVKYNSILEAEYESPALYYNLGNSYYRSAQIGFAILNYERGLKLDPSNEDLLYNLSIVKARTVDKIKEVPKLFIVEWWELLISALSTTMWQIVVLLFFILWIGSITLYFITKSGTTQRLTIFSALVGLSGAIFFSIILFANVQREASTDYGILTINTISAKQSPNESSNDLFVIHEGLKVAVLDKFGDWYRIKLSDGKVGWLPKKSLEVI